MLSAIPFWFLPRSLSTAECEAKKKGTQEQKSFIKDSPHLKHKYTADEHASFVEMAKGKDR